MEKCWAGSGGLGESGCLGPGGSVSISFPSPALGSLPGLPRLGPAPPDRDPMALGCLELTTTSTPGQPQPSPQPARSWSRDCASQDHHGRLAAEEGERTAASMPWEPTWRPGSPVPQDYSSQHALGRSFLLSDPAGTPSPGPAPPPRRPHGRLAGAALSPALEPRGSREEEEEEERGPERQRGVGQGGGVAGEGQEVDRGTRDGQREEKKRRGAGQGVEEGKWSLL